MRIGFTALALLFTIATGYTLAQTQPATPLPEAPVAQTLTAPGNGEPQSSATPTATRLKDPEAADGDSLYAPLATGRGPQTLSQKTRAYVVASFGPRAFVSPAFTAGMRMASPPSGYPREWRMGAAAYGRNYGATLGDRVAQLTGRYAVGSVLHEDFRYRPSDKQGVARVFYALGYTFADRTDSGHRTFAAANFAGAAAGGFIVTLYLPDGYNSSISGEKNAALRFGGLAANNVAREYAPEIRRLTRKLHLPFPRVPSREWWTQKSPAAEANSSTGAPAAKDSSPAVATTKTAPPLY